MDYRITVDETHSFIKSFFAKDASGHDYWHAYRVWQNAKHIARHEHADSLVVELAALLHDVADRKFTGGDKVRGINAISTFLSSLNVEHEVIDHVCEIAAHMSYSDSFKEGKHISRMKTIEGSIVQDADRLDAMGAIGIARAFAYGGAEGRSIYDPRIKPSRHMTAKDYTANVSHSVNHFYEKLLLLRDLMNTKTGRAIASGRHKYMERYLKQFYGEWQGEL